MSLIKRVSAEFIGTFWLVFGGCGSAVLAAAFPSVGIGLLGVSLAFGLTVLTMAYAIGHISGCHLNPAVSIGLVTSKRFPARELLPYIVAQVIGGIVGAGLLYLIASGKPGFNLIEGFAANGYGAHSPGGYSLLAGAIAETVLTFMFLLIILGATDRRAPRGLAPIAIGFGLTLIHLISIPVTNTSVNPARSTGPAVFVGDWALSQLWLFWVAPIIGAVLAGVVYRWLGEEIPKAEGQLDELFSETITTKRIEISFDASGDGVISCKGLGDFDCQGLNGVTYPQDITVQTTDKEIKHWSTEFQVWMPFAIRIWPQRGIYIHEWGFCRVAQGQSAGCIHVCPGNAEKIYNWVDGPTRITIKYPW
jgi:aquaporin Z